MIPLGLFRAYLAHDHHLLMSWRESNRIIHTLSFVAKHHREINFGFQYRQ